MLTGATYAAYEKDGVEYFSISLNIPGSSLLLVSAYEYFIEAYEQGPDFINEENKEYILFVSISGGDELRHGNHDLLPNYSQEYDTNGKMVGCSTLKGAGGTNAPSGWIEPIESDDGIEYTSEDDFEWVDEEGTSGIFIYTGEEDIVKIPHIIQGKYIYSYEYMFGKGSSPVKKVISYNPNIRNMDNMFRNFKSNSLDLSDLNTSAVNSMDFMFLGSQINSINLTNFDTSNVFSMEKMFGGSSFLSLDLSDFDTSNVTNMHMMFSNSSTKSLDLRSFDTSKVTDMSAMFSNNQATSLDLSSFNTSKVTKMDMMFYKSQATSLDLSSFNTSNVTTMDMMFAATADLEHIDLSSFDTSNVTDMGSMFSRSQAANIDLRTFDTSKVTHMDRMFQYTQAKMLDLGSFDTSSLTDSMRMFYNSQAVTGYARTQADEDRFNASSGKPAGLIFIVKP